MGTNNSHAAPSHSTRVPSMSTASRSSAAITPAHAKPTRKYSTSCLKSATPNSQTENAQLPSTRDSAFTAPVSRPDEAVTPPATDVATSSILTPTTATVIPLTAKQKDISSSIPATADHAESSVAHGLKEKPKETPSSISAAADPTESRFADGATLSTTSPTIPLPSPTNPRTTTNIPLASATTPREFEISTIPVASANAGAVVQPDRQSTQAKEAASNHPASASLQTPTATSNITPIIVQARSSTTMGKAPVAGQSDSVPIPRVVKRPETTRPGSSAMHASMSIGILNDARTQENIGTVTQLGEQVLPTSNTQRTATPTTRIPIFEPTHALNNLSRPVKLLRRNRGAHQPSARYGADVQRTVESSRLHGSHDWCTVPVADMNFTRFVSDSRSSRRKDMQRFSEFAVRVGRQEAMNIWARYAGSHPWFVIPTSMSISRTFVRDELEVLYVDIMSRFIDFAAALNRRVHVKIHVLPLVVLGDPLVSRWWNQPRVAGNILREQDFWHYHNIMYPYDSCDYALVDEDVERLRELYPATPEWWSVVWFPAAVPCPTPPSVLYFNERMTVALLDYNHVEYDLWRSVLELEYAVLFASTWWHEAARGHRGVVIPEDTIHWLEQRLGDEPIDPDTPHGPAGQTTVKWIAARMRQVGRVPRRFANLLIFPGTHLPPSHFIWTECSTAFPNLNETGGRRFSRSCKNGKIYEKDVQPNRYGAQPPINRRQPQPEPLPGNDGYGTGRQGWYDPPLLPFHGADRLNLRFNSERTPRRRALNDRSYMEVDTNNPVNYWEDNRDHGGRRIDDHRHRGHQEYWHGGLQNGRYEDRHHDERPYGDGRWEEWHANRHYDQDLSEPYGEHDNNRARRRNDRLGPDDFLFRQDRHESGGPVNYDGGRQNGPNHYNDSHGNVGANHGNGGYFNGFTGRY